jgi:hypothetical protein
MIIIAPLFVQEAERDPGIKGALGVDNLNNEKSGPDTSAAPVMFVKPCATELADGLVFRKPAS